MLGFHPNREEIEMGMAIYNEPERKPRGKGLTLCKHCDAEYSNNGGWVRAYQTSTGTQTPAYRFVREIPAGVCPVCEK